MRKQWMLKGLLLLLVVGGSASAERAQPPIDDKALKLTVQVDVMLHGSGQRRPVMAGEVLGTGDRLAVRAEAARNAYVFVLHESPTSSLEVLVPTTDRSGGLPLPAGVQTSLPPGGAMLELDATTGKESLYVIAATRALTRDEAKDYGRRARLSLLDKRPAATSSTLSGPPVEVGLRGAPPPPAPPPPPPPPHPIGSAERQPPCDARVHIAPPIADEREPVMVARFCFEHSGEPREAALPFEKKSRPAQP